MQSAVLQGFASATHFSFGALPPSQPAGVHTSVTYVDPPQQGEHLYNKTAPAEGEKRTNFIPREVDVVVHDMRQSQEAFDLDRHGFELRELLVMEDLDWTDEQQARLVLPSLPLDYLSQTAIWNAARPREVLALALSLHCPVVD